MADPNDETPDSLVGRSIAGKYRIEALVGSGAMGAVYKARQIVLDKIVAVKVLHRGIQKTRDLTNRFKREAKAASRLDHPSSVRVLDFGVEPDGLLYMVMEYLDGEDLYTLNARERPLAPARIADLLSQVLAALGVAHEMGVIHRDLKPENIMVLGGKDDEGRVVDVVKVCDFGIAKILDVEQANTGESGRLSSAGLIMGTPQYMSPEHARGEPLDARADIYSIGVILYELIAGQPPFDAENAFALALKHVTEEPRPPREIRPDVDARLERIALKALSKSKEERFQSAREMRVALRRIVDAQHGELPPASPTTVAGRYVIAARIGSGGMARVHLGRLIGTDGFSRVVAMKRLHPHLAEDEVFVRSFMDEARLASRIRHQNVVQTIDVVREGNEVLLVMEYVPGESLATLLALARERGERTPPKIAAAILCDALMGLHAAHEATDEAGRPLEIVHRDMSPENVLVGTDGVARVLDFGVAKASGRRQITEGGNIKGKLAYMAPEQVLRQPLTRRVDIFAAGVVAWEALVGRRLRGGELKSVTDILTAEIGPPTRHAPDLPPSIDAIIAKATAREPSRRYENARELAIALERALGSAPRWEVSEWVMKIAGKRLEARAELVAGVEAFADPQREKVPPESFTGADQKLETLTDASIHLALVRRQPVRRRGLILVLTAGAVALVAAVFGLSRRASPPFEDAQPASSAPASAFVAAHSAPAAPPGSLLHAVDAEASALPVSSPRDAAPAHSVRPIRFDAATVPSSVPRCDPPWIERAGIRYPKPECF